MKKKMNMLCVVILVFTIVMVAASFHFVFYFHDMDKPVMELFVSPSHFGDDNCVMFTDGASGKPVKGWASRVFVETGKDTFNVKTGMKMIALAPLSLIGPVRGIPHQVCHRREQGHGVHLEDDTAAASGRLGGAGIKRVANHNVRVHAVHRVRHVLAKGLCVRLFGRHRANIVAAPRPAVAANGADVRHRAEAEGGTRAGGVTRRMVKEVVEKE